MHKRARGHKELKVGDIHTYTIVENTEDTFKITFNIKPEVYVDEIIVHPVRILPVKTEQREL